MSTGIKPSSKNPIDEKKLEDLFYSNKDRMFYELVEAAHHSIFENYHCRELSDDLNTIFERSYVGIRVKDGEFVFIEEEMEYEEFMEPCLTILHDGGFDQANDHLCEAIDKCHEGDFNKAVLESSLALESVVNQILDEMNIQLPEKMRKNDFIGRFKLLKENGVAIFQDDEAGKFLQSVYSPIRARNNMPDVAHSGSDDYIGEEEAQYVLGMAVSSILYIVRSYLNKP